MNKQRRSIRLSQYDYCQPGIYFITICSAQNRPVFGKIEKGVVQMNAYGDIVAREWLTTAEKRPEVDLDFWVVMPDHFHGILTQQNVTVGAQRAAPDVRLTRDSIRAQHAAPLRTMAYPRGATRENVSSGSVGAVIRAFKSSVTREINRYRNAHQLQPVNVWQRNYYEHIIRNEKEFIAIQRYISENPQRWDMKEVRSP